LILKKVHLHSFFGFEDFSVDLGRLTALLGPNNGGKTTMLRGVHFALQGLREAFNPQPVEANIRRDPLTVNLQNVANRAGIDLTFFRNRRFNDLPAVSLWFETDKRTVEVRVREQGPTGYSGPDSLVVECFVDGAAVKELRDEDALAALRGVHSYEPDLVQFVGPILPTEGSMDWGTLQNQLVQGKASETWRNQLHWRMEGKDPESQARVVARVRDLLQGVDARPPRRSPTTGRLELEYFEGGIEYEISAAGGGLRTLLSVIAAVELAEASVLLLDEPDAHLHPSLQRRLASFLQEPREKPNQILLATHTPDFIEELPVESLVWIDSAGPYHHRPVLELLMGFQSLENLEIGIGDIAVRGDRAYVRCTIRGRRPGRAGSAAEVRREQTFELLREPSGWRIADHVIS